MDQYKITKNFKDLLEYSQFHGFIWQQLIIFTFKCQIGDLPTK